MKKISKAKTLAALDDSIEHWNRLANNKQFVGESIFCDDCALCKEFSGPISSLCEGCPVSKATGHHNCKGTPWGSVRHALELYGKGSDMFMKRASEMHSFLVSLRPGVEFQGVKFRVKSVRYTLPGEQLVSASMNINALVPFVESTWGKFPAMLESLRTVGHWELEAKSESTPASFIRVDVVKARKR